MARPKKEKTLDRRVSVRLSAETYAAYEGIAAAFDVPVGQLMRQILTLEVPELQELVAALSQWTKGVPFAAYQGPVAANPQELFRQASQHGGFAERLRYQAAMQYRPDKASREEGAALRKP
ncbi:MAG: hypothetical protein U0232_27435 [Thermomicrobiales bacterium]